MNDYRLTVRGWLGLIVGLVGVLLLLGTSGMRWRNAVRLEAVEVQGTHCATPEDILRLASVEGDSLLYHVEPSIVADRVRRHPWVEHARATRLPTGRLVISVEERRPVLLAVDHGGRPVYYIDASGHRMPVVDEAVADVPLLWGLDEDYSPLLPVAESRVLELAGLMPGLGGDVDALLSEFEISRDGVVLYTTAWPERNSIRVHLGNTRFESRIERLFAFWHQVVLSGPGDSPASIDLRFDSQIITS